MRPHVAAALEQTRSPWPTTASRPDLRNGPQKKRVHCQRNPQQPLASRIPRRTHRAGRLVVFRKRQNRRDTIIDRLRWIRNGKRSETLQNARSPYRRVGILQLAQENLGASKASNSGVAHDLICHSCCFRRTRSTRQGRSWSRPGRSGDRRRAVSRQDPIAGGRPSRTLLGSRQGRLNAELENRKR
jgi:hypothetical protein